MAQFFFSYSKADQGLADIFYKLFTETGHELVDRNTLDPNAKIQGIHVLQMGLAGTIFLLTPRAMQDQQFRNELGFAANLPMESGGEKTNICFVLGLPDVLDDYANINRVYLDASRPLVEQTALILRAFDPTVQGQNAEPENMIPDYSEEPDYWILKINDSTWPLERFARGQHYEFAVNHHFNEFQADRQRFYKLQAGDYLLALALERLNQVVALFRVNVSFPQNQTIQK